jgi:hypothetical protein
MGTGERGDRALRAGPTTGRGHTLLTRVTLLVALVLFTILWLLLAPGSAAAAL